MSNGWNSRWLSFSRAGITSTAIKSAELRPGEEGNQAGTSALPRSSLLLSPSPWLSASKIAPRLHHGLSQTSRPVACFISVMAWVSTQRPHAIPASRGAVASYCIGLRVLHLRHQKKKAPGVSRITVWVKADGSAQRMSLCSKNDIQKKATNRGKLSFCFPETFWLPAPASTLHMQKLQGTMQKEIL